MSAVADKAAAFLKGERDLVRRGGGTFTKAQFAVIEKQLGGGSVSTEAVNELLGSDHDINASTFQVSVIVRELAKSAVTEIRARRGASVAQIATSALDGVDKDAFMLSFRSVLDGAKASLEYSERSLEAIKDPDAQKVAEQALSETRIGIEYAAGFDSPDAILESLKAAGEALDPLAKEYIGLAKLREFALKALETTKTGGTVAAGFAKETVTEAFIDRLAAGVQDHIDANRGKLIGGLDEAASDAARQGVKELLADRKATLAALIHPTTDAAAGNFATVAELHRYVRALVNRSLVASEVTGALVQRVRESISGVAPNGGQTSDAALTAHANPDLARDHLFKGIDAQFGAKAVTFIKDLSEGARTDAAAVEGKIRDILTMARPDAGSSASPVWEAVHGVAQQVLTGVEVGKQSTNVVADASYTDYQRLLDDTLWKGVVSKVIADGGKTNLSGAGKDVLGRIAEEAEANQGYEKIVHIALRATKKDWSKQVAQNWGLKAESAGDIWDFAQTAAASLIAARGTASSLKVATQVVQDKAQDLSLAKAAAPVSTASASLTAAKATSAKTLTVARSPFARRSACIRRRHDAH